MKDDPRRASLSPKRSIKEREAREKMIPMEKMAPRVARSLGPDTCWKASTKGGPPAVVIVPITPERMPAKMAMRFEG